jgi:hypothetical protein
MSGPSGVRLFFFLVEKFLSFRRFLLLLVALVVSSAAQFSLPDVCLCNPSGNVSVISCSFRPSKNQEMMSCFPKIQLLSDVTLQKGPLSEKPGNMSCLCLTNIPEFADTAGLVNLLISGAEWGVLYPNGQFSTSRIIDKVKFEVFVLSSVLKSF